MSSQISIFSKDRTELIEDCSKFYTTLIKGSIHELYLEKENDYIILIVEEK